MQPSRKVEFPKRAHWRDGFGPNEKIQRVRPRHTTQFLNNPHKGTATFQRLNGDELYPTDGWSDADGPLEFPPPRNPDLSNDNYPPTRVAYCRWLWRALEPEKGQVRLDVIEKALDEAARRGQTLQIRVQPYIGKDAPSWYWRLGGKPVGNSWEIDHNHPAYLQHWGDLLRAIGTRFDGHPVLESVDVAYGGSCGECGGNASNETAERLVDLYFEAFPKTQLVVMQGTHGAKYAIAKTRQHIGWRADCYGDLRSDGHGVVPDELCWNHMYDEYPKEFERMGMWDLWRYAPITLETCWTVLYWYRKGWDLDWILEHGLKYHPTIFMPKSVRIPEEWMDRIMAFDQRLGYWYWLHQMELPLKARRGEKIKVAVVIDNKGVAPIYRRYDFALSFTQGSKRRVVRFAEDIRRWLPDYSFFEEQIMVPPELEPGEVEVACGIIDAQGRPAVRMAIEAVDSEGWHPLTGMEIVS